MKCSGNRLNRLSRRGVIASGFLGGLGLGLVDFLRFRAAAETQSAKLDDASGDHTKSPPAKSVIHLYLPGGMAQQESFDPKPFAPMEYRGDLGAVKAKTGEHFSSAMRRLAGVADKLTVIRSMTHTDAAHERGTEHMFTGYPPSPAISYPSMGSVVSHELGPRNNLPPYVCVPNLPNPWAANGYLSSAFAPFSLGSDPARGDFRVKDLNLPNGISPERFAKRRQALSVVNAAYGQSTSADNVIAMNTFYERAYSLLDSVDAREAFDISKEPGKVRDRYGRNQAGQRLLMARRLVQAGVRLVSLTYGGWDNHNSITRNFRRQMPPLDQALAALINDLDASGRLDETLILVTSEFGRTPKINATAGRDHWPRVFSVMLAGGGIKRGYTHGASNATASEPEDSPVAPADLAATVYHQLGINAEDELMSSGNRPIEIVKDGRIIHEILT